MMLFYFARALTTPHRRYWGGKMESAAKVNYNVDEEEVDEFM
jgi:hypothetical protein